MIRSQVKDYPDIIRKKNHNSIRITSLYSVSVQVIINVQLFNTARLPVEVTKCDTYNLRAIINQLLSYSFNFIFIINFAELKLSQYINDRRFTYPKSELNSFTTSAFQLFAVYAHDGNEFHRSLTIG